MNRLTFRPPATAAHSFALAALLGWLGVTATAPLHAQMAYTDWTGAGTSADLGNGGNWQGGIAPPDDGSANVVFDAGNFVAGKGNLNPDLTYYNWSFNTLMFAGGSSFTIGTTNNRGLNLGSGLTQNSTAAQTISVPTFLTDDQTWSFGANAGALNFTSTSTSGQIITQNHALSFNVAGTATLNGSIGQGGELSINGPGTLIFTGNNTYTGGTNFIGGTLQAGSAGALGSTGALTFQGGTLQYSAANQTDYSARFFTSNSQPYNVDTNGQNVTFATALGGSSLVKLGAGTLTLAAAPTYQGGTTVNGGTLTVGAGITLSGNVTVGGGGTLALSGTASATLGNLVLQSVDNTTPNAVFTAGSGSLRATNFSVTGVVSQTGYSVNTTNLFLGNVASTLASSYTLGGTGSVIVNELRIGIGSAGTFTQNAGSTQVNSIINLGYGSTGTLTVNGGTLNSGTQGTIVGATNPGSGVINLSSGTINAGSTLIGYQGPGTLQQSGGTFSTNGSALELGFYSQSGNVSIVGPLPEPGQARSALPARLVPGPSYVPPTYNSYGTISLSGGTLSTGTVTVGDRGVGDITQSGGVLTTNGATLTLASQKGSQGFYELDGGTLTVGAITAGAGASSFGFNGGTLQAASNSTNFFSGVQRLYGSQARLDTNGFSVTISMALTGIASLNKLGAGTLMLSGSNTYAGGTLISAGTLVAPGGSALGTGNVEIANGARLTLNAGVVLASMTDSTLTLDSATNSTVNLLGSGVQDTVATLVVAGVTQLPGTYGALGSGALFVLPDFTGTGELLVTSVPEPSTWALLGVGAAAVGFTMRRRRRHVAGV